MNETFSLFLWAMTVLALAVFVALHFVEAGYGYLFNRKFGPGIPNRIGWMAMESPVFIAMCILWLCSDRALEAGPLALFILFQSHYQLKQVQGISSQVIFERSSLSNLCCVYV